MTFRKILGVLTCAILGATLLVGCGADKKASDAPKGDEKAIVVGLDDNFPPMGFRDEKNEIVGFDIDLAKEAATRLGRPIEFKAIDWSSKEAELKSGRVDILWNGLDITEKRKENILFSEPYMKNRQVIFVKKGTNDIVDAKSLEGKVVGTQSGSSTEDYYEEHADLRNAFKDYKKYSDFVAALMDLENGRLDAVVGDEIMGRYYISKHPDGLEVVDVDVIPAANFGIGFSKDSQKLRDEVQKVIDEMKKDGTAAKISETWFGKDLLLK